MSGRAIIRSKINAKANLGGSGGGGGSAITVSDEGTPLTPNVTSFDFIGTGVSATAIGDAVTVNIPGISGINANWGTFWDNNNQIGSIIGTTPVNLTVGDPNNNAVSVSGINQIIVANAGTYNIQYSLQFENSDSNGSAHHDVNVWIRINGFDVADTASMFEVPTRHGGYNGKVDAVSNHVMQLNAGDAIQVMWQPEVANITLKYSPAGTTPTTPETPSAYVTVTQVAGVIAGGGGGGGNPIEVYDEGNLLTGVVSSFDFIGAGVTATSVGSAVTVNIPGGGGAIFIVDTYANISALASTNSLFPGGKYKITDVFTDAILPDWQVIIMADSTSTFGKDAEIIVTDKSLGTYKFHGQYNFVSNIITRVVDTIYNNIVEAESSIAMDNIIREFQWNNPNWTDNVITGNSTISFSFPKPNIFKSNNITGNSIINIALDPGCDFFANTVHFSKVEINNSFIGNLTFANNYIYSTYKTNTPFVPNYGITINYLYNTNPTFVCNNHVENSSIYVNNCTSYTVISNNYLFNAINSYNNLTTTNQGIYLQNLTSVGVDGEIKDNILENNSYIHFVNATVTYLSGNTLKNFGTTPGVFFPTNFIYIDDGDYFEFINNKLTNGSVIRNNAEASTSIFYFQFNNLINCNLFIEFSYILSFKYNTIEFTDGVANDFNLDQFRYAIGDFVGNKFLDSNFKWYPVLSYFRNITQFKNNEIINTELDFKTSCTINTFNDNYIKDVKGFLIEVIGQDVLRPFDFIENTLISCSSFILNKLDIKNFRYNKIVNSSYEIYNLKTDFHDSNDVVNSVIRVYEPLILVDDNLFSFSRNIISDSNLRFYFDDKDYDFYYDDNKIHKTKFIPAKNNDDVPIGCLLNSCTLLNANNFNQFGIKDIYFGKTCIRGQRSTFTANINLDTDLVGVTLTFDPDYAGFVGIYTTTATGGYNCNIFVNAPQHHSFYIFGPPNQILTFNQGNNLELFFSGSQGIGGPLRANSPTSSFIEFNLFSVDANYIMLNTNY